MPVIQWKEAIRQVLEESGEPMHYSDISDAIVERGLRGEDIGATPSATVAANLSMSIKEGASSPFVRISRGLYGLRAWGSLRSSAPERDAYEDVREAGFINAFGMYWSRDKVDWSARPRVLGQQQRGSTPVDFSEQRGVYLLHDRRAVVYVGRTTEQPMGIRLRQHTVDRLNGRWDRFSWFGIHPVRDDGQLLTDRTDAFSTDTLIATMEALLIEGLEPPQNRKRGDDFNAVEFLQADDPAMERDRTRLLLAQLMERVGS